LFLQVSNNQQQQQQQQSCNSTGQTAWIQKSLLRYAGASHGVCLSCVHNAEAQQCHRAAMSMQAAVEHLELAGHEMILPILTICMP